MNDTQPGRNGGTLRKGNPGNKGRPKKVEKYDHALTLNQLLLDLNKFAMGHPVGANGRRPSYMEQMEAIKILLKMAQSLPEGVPLSRAPTAAALVESLNAERKLPWRTRARIFCRVCQTLDIDAEMPRDPRSLVPKRSQADLALQIEEVIL